MRSGAALERRPAAPAGPFRLLPPAEHDLVRHAVRELLEVPYGVERRLRGAVATTLTTPGSLWRAQLAWAASRAEGLDIERSLTLACAVEAFHVASLLFDDLPAMDDAEARRGRPCVHRTHGEAAAMLAALAFVHEGHDRVGRALDDAPPERRRRARKLLSASLGLSGLLDGQARDLHPETRAASRDEILRQAAGKTVPLLALALVLPAVVAGADEPRVAKLGELAESLGLAYQLIDDLADASGPTAEPSNAARDLGAAAARREIARQLARASDLATDPAGTLPGLEAAVAATIARFDEAAASAA